MSDFSSLENYIIVHRRYLHQHPELGFNCKNTHEYIKAELEKLHIEYIPNIGKYSLIGKLENGTGPVIGLRADFDALPILEATDLEFESVNRGVMHACGHDAHTAMLLGVAKYLSENLDKWRGTVKFIFQEAEEGPNPGGAYKIVKSGYVDDCEEFFALHVSPAYDSGVIAVNQKAALAAADIINLKLIGKGAHAAYPHLGIDPIMMQADFITSLQAIISRKLDPTDPGVITIAKVKAGTTHNVIPDFAVLEGTARCFSESTRKLFEEEVDLLANTIAKKYHGDYKLHYTRGYDPLINDPESAREFEISTKKLFGDKHFRYLDKPSMGAEDFSRYLNIGKGAMAWLGVKNGSGDYPIHHAKFNLDENALIIGARVLIDIIMRKEENHENNH